MSVLDYFRRDRKGSANVAKDRLQVIVAHQRRQRNAPPYLAELQNELLAVIRKYVEVSEDQVEVQVDNDGGVDVLELNVTLG